MPGRGTPWREGGHVDDTIVGDDIKDGSITEADLDSGVTAKLNSGGGHEILEEGASLPQRARLNFIGAGVVASDGIEDTTDVTIAGGGGSFNREELASPFDDLWFFDEFFYPNPNEATANWHFEHGGSGLSVPSGIGGVVEYGNTAVAGTIARLNICGAGQQAIDSSKRLIMKCRFKINNQSATKAWMLGFFTPNTDGPTGTFPFSNKQTNGLGFFADGSGNVETYSDDNITPVQTDTGVLQDGLVHTYEVDFDPAGTPTITFKIDGATVATQTTNLPSFNGAWYLNAQTDDAITGASIEIDTLFIFNER